MVEIYWLLLVPYVVFMVCLEFFKLPEGEVKAGRILKRAVISMLLLYSFEQCMNTLAIVSDGITEKIGGIVQLKELLKHLWDDLKSREVSWLHVREHILYTVSLFSYIVAYVGVFTADVLIHFVWSIWFVVSPLMILMYVSERTAFVTANLYRGLINVVTWKIFYCILGVLLLKIATNPEVAKNADNFVMGVTMNLCIGLSMLFIPFATKSLVTNGFEGAATALAAAPAAAASGAVKLYAMKYGKQAATGVAKAASWTAKEPFRGFRGSRELAGRGYHKLKTGFERSRETANHVSANWKKVRSYGVSEARSTSSPFDKRGPFGKNGRDRILKGKE